MGFENQNKPSFPSCSEAQLRKYELKIDIFRT